MVWVFLYYYYYYFVGFFFHFLCSPKVPHVVVHSGSHNRQVFTSAGLRLHNHISDSLQTRVCSRKPLLLPHQRKPLSCSASSRVTSFTLNMFCRMRLTSSCCFLSGWSPLSRQVLFLVRRIPPSMRC